jgi:hypothetical protein
MVIVEPHVTRGKDEVRCRADVLQVMGLYHAVILQPASLDDLDRYLDQCARECRAFMVQHHTRWSGLTNVIVIGHADSPYVARVANQLAPGESVLVLPIPDAWEALHERRDQIRAVLQGRAQQRGSVH